MRGIIKNIYKKIKEYDEIIIVRHVGPDPDAVASQIALRDSIKLTFPDKKVYAIGKSVSRFKFLGRLDKAKNLELNNPLLIMLDLPNVKRADDLDDIEYSEVIKIDHHPFEEPEGSIDWIDPSASSTCQMVAKLIFNSKLKMDDVIASKLFVGIVSDSERFLLDYTSVETFEVVSKLLKNYNINFQEQYNNLYLRPLNEVRFQSFITLNLNVSDNGFAHLKIKKEDIEEYKVDTSSASNMVNNFNYIKEILVWTFIVYDEKNEVYKINIRSRGPIINNIAAKYNGGGHKFASGARIKDESDIENLLKDLDDACKKYRKKRP